MALQARVCHQHVGSAIMHTRLHHHTVYNRTTSLRLDVEDGEERGGGRRRRRRKLPQAFT